MDNMEANGFRSKSADGLESPKLEHQVDDEDSESNPLLPPKKDEMSRKTDRKRLKVQWNDRHGNQLAQVLEFVPRRVGIGARIAWIDCLISVATKQSDVSDTEDDDSDFCICVVM